MEDLIIPEYGTAFHRWYKEEYGEELEMSYTETYKQITNNRNEELLELVNEYLHVAKEKWAQYYNKPLVYTIRKD